MSLGYFKNFDISNEFTICNSITFSQIQIEKLFQMSITTKTLTIYRTRIKKEKIKPEAYTIKKSFVFPKTHNF
jgi:hypothetical protein